MIYLVCFGISLLLIKIKVKGKGDMVVDFIALLIPCILAGLRADTVGTDTADYPLTMYNLALTNTYLDYMDTQFMHMWVLDYVRDMGIGYASFVYVIANISGDFGMLLFFTHVVIVFSIYGAVKNVCKEKYVWIGMMIFYLLFYNVSLNAIRQWMAMAILLYAYTEFLDKKRIWILYAAVGISFHSTAICGLLVFLLYLIFDKIDIPKIRFDRINKISGSWLIIISVIAVGIYFLTHMEIVRYMIQMMSLADFLNYFQGAIKFSIKRFVLEIPLVMLCLINWKYFEDDKDKYFVLLFSMVNMMLSQLNTMNVLAWRISAYVSMFTVIYFPKCVQACKDKGKRILETVAVGIYGFVHWSYYYVILNAHGTLPYKFR